MLRIKLQSIRDASMKHPGMWQDFTAAGTLLGAELEISREAFDRIAIKYGGTLKLGSLIHSVLSPFATAIDRVLGTDLSNCGGCAERELRMNDMI